MWLYISNSAQNFIFLLFVNNFFLAFEDYTPDDLERCRKTSSEIAERDRGRLHIQAPFDRLLYKGWDIIKANSSSHFIFDYTFKDCHYFYEFETMTFNLLGDQSGATTRKYTSTSHGIPHMKSMERLPKMIPKVGSIFPTLKNSGTLSTRFSLAKKFLSGTFNGTKINKLKDPSVSYYCSCGWTVEAYLFKSYTSLRFTTIFAESIQKLANILPDNDENSKNVSTELNSLVNLFGTHFWDSAVFGSLLLCGLSVNSGLEEIDSLLFHNGTDEEGDLVLVEGGEWLPLSKLMTVKYFPKQTELVMKNMAEHMDRFITNYDEKYTRKGCTLFEASKFDVNANENDGTCYDHDHDHDHGNLITGNVLYVLLQSSFITLFFYCSCHFLL